MKKITALVLAVLLLAASLCSCSLFEFDNDAANAAYREYLKQNIPSDNTVTYSITDINGNGSKELVVVYNATISVYTYKTIGEKAVEKIGEMEYKYHNNTFRSKNEKYAGIFVFYQNGGLDTYAYITLKGRKLVLQKLWDVDAYGRYMDREKMVQYTDDEALLEAARKVFEERTAMIWYDADIIDYKGEYLSADPSKDDSYNRSVMIYGDYLYRNNFVGGYTLCDVNGDEVPELITTADELFTIYTIDENSVDRMYACVSNYQHGPIKVLTNGDILAKHDNEYTEYTYDDLGPNFETIKTITFGYREDGGNTEYIFEGEKVSKEDYDKLTKEYLEVGEVMLVWMPDVYTKYEQARAKYDKNPENSRDIGPFLMETQEIIILDGKYYQSNINDATNTRYVLVNHTEYDMWHEWAWISVGTKDTYSLDLLGKMEGTNSEQ